MLAMDANFIRRVLVLIPFLVVLLAR